MIDDRARKSEPQPMVRAGWRHFAVVSAVILLASACGGKSVSPGGEGDAPRSDAGGDERGGDGGVEGRGIAAGPRRKVRRTAGKSARAGLSAVRFRHLRRGTPAPSRDRWRIGAVLVSGRDVQQLQLGRQRRGLLHVHLHRRDVGLRGLGPLATKVRLLHAGPRRRQTRRESRELPEIMTLPGLASRSLVAPATRRWSRRRRPSSARSR